MGFIRDEGGPILHAPLSPVYQDSLIAINSFTIGKCDELDSVAIGTNVEAFLDWIDEICKTTVQKGCFDGGFSGIKLFQRRFRGRKESFEGRGKEEVILKGED